jgi:hypothetical protein
MAEGGGPPSAMSSGSLMSMMQHGSGGGHGGGSSPPIEGIFEMGGQAIDPKQLVEKAFFAHLLTMGFASAISDANIFAQLGKVFEVSQSVIGQISPPGIFKDVVNQKRALLGKSSSEGK